MDKLPIARRIVKAIAMAVGLAGTVVCLMALVGLVTERTWVRLLVALVVAVAVPALIADRLIVGEPAQSEGLTSDVFAVSWMLVVVGVAVVGGSVSRPMLTAEADRLARADMSLFASAAYLLAGVEPRSEISTDGAGVGATSSPVAAEGSAPASSPPAPSTQTTSATIEEAEASGDAEEAEEADEGDEGEVAAEAEGAEGTADEPSTADGTEASEEGEPAEWTAAELFERWGSSIASLTVASERGIDGATAFVIDDAGHLATSHRAMAGAEAAAVTFPNGARYDRVWLVDDDPEAGIALIRIELGEATEGERPDVSALTVADEARIGDRAVALTNALGLEVGLTTGAVLAHLEDGDRLVLSMPPVVGDGAPVLDPRGEVIGVTIVGPAGRSLATPARHLTNLLRSDHPKARALASGRKLFPR